MILTRLWNRPKTDETLLNLKKADLDSPQLDKIFILSNWL